VSIFRQILWVPPASWITSREGGIMNENPICTECGDELCAHGYCPHCEPGICGECAKKLVANFEYDQEVGGESG
jgi:hypothetical protein